tara:strand:+ start:60 stop:779 length:720 start_codon:yes stop_codon:yes gene_type:complete
VSEQILSPDGKFVWSGKEWIPLTPSITNNNYVKDSVVMGGIVNQTTIHVENNEQAKVENYLKLMHESYISGNMLQGQMYHQKALEIDYTATRRIYDSKYNFLINNLRYKEMQKILAISRNQKSFVQDVHICLGYWTMIQGLYVEIKKDNSSNHIMQALKIMVEFIELWFEVQITQNHMKVEQYLHLEYTSIQQGDLGNAILKNALQVRKTAAFESLFWPAVFCIGSVGFLIFILIVIGS